MAARACLLVMCVGSAIAADIDDYSRLLSDLLVNYSTIVPPALKGVNVSHSLSLIRIISLENQVLTVKTFDYMSWSDPRLSWEPSKYGDISEARLPAARLWLPDITLYNDATCDGSQPWGDINVHVSSTGTVNFIPMVVTRSFCDNKGKAPKKNRKLKCKLAFGSWVYSADMLDIYNPSGNFDLSNFVASPTWKLVESSAVRIVKKYVCCTEPYTTVEYSLTLKAVS